MDARAASERENEVPFVAMNSEMKKEYVSQVLDAARPQRIHARNIRKIIENQ
jgi:ribosome recycling factor